MPKVVDRTQRRDALAAALWRLAYREGWNAVSLRRVAAEAGLSLGSLQHYFAGLDDLLDYSVSGVLDILDERLVDQLTTLAEPADAESTVREALQGMIPGAVVDPAAERPDDSWRIQVMAWLAVVNRAARNPEMSARLSAGSDRLAAAIAAALCTSAIGRSREEALREARGLLALVEGLLLQLARGSIEPGEASSVISGFVARVFG
ncbi:TetR/AcrR family transcriptional regulator [Nocardia sp. NPDC004068]|uniref:TetR/AcrR family transcriptional regulator n=1 Tax=Nocardia sp. NPDC004068 TaxID=3364303 RepID=UPI00368AEB0B